MRNLHRLLLIVIVGLIATFTSCGDDDAPAPATHAPERVVRAPQRTPALVLLERTATPRAVPPVAPSSARLPPNATGPVPAPSPSIVGTAPSAKDKVATGVALPAMARRNASSRRALDRSGRAATRRTASSTSVQVARSPAMIRRRAISNAMEVAL